MVIVTSPAEIALAEDLSPFQAADPDDLVFCCFFRGPEQRTELLGSLRRLAGTPLPAGADPLGLEASLEAEYREQMATAGHAEALSAAVRWRTLLQRKGYHTYTLRVGFEPYRASCVIAFDELAPQTIHRNMEIALLRMRDRRERVLDSFGLGGL